MTSTLPTTIEEIGVYLNEFPQETTLRFEMLLAEAQSIQDNEQVRRLVTAAEALLADDPYLQQWRAYARGYLAFAHEQQPDEAISLLESLRRKQTDWAPHLPERVLNGLGILYERQERWDKAMQCYQDCILLCQAEKNNLGLGKALFNLAIIHYKGLDYTAAIASIERSISLLGQKPDDKVWQTNLGRAWNELGLVQMQLGNLIEAQTAFERYLAICQRWDYRIGEGFAYTNLGHIQRRLNQPDKAVDYYARSREILLEAGNLFEAAEAIYGLALLDAQVESSFERAETRLEKALAAAESGNNYEITTQIYLDKAKLADRMSNPAAALAENRRAVETVEALRANIALSEARIRLQGSRIEAYEQMVSRLCQSSAGYAEAFHFAEMAKSRALIEMLADRRIRPPENIPPEWLEEENRLRESLRALYRGPGEQTAQIATLEAELGQLRQRIRLQNAEYQSFQTVTPLPLEKVMTALPVGGVLLEYFIAGDSIWAFVITAAEINVTCLPLRLQDLERAFVSLGDENRQLRHLLPGESDRLHQPWILNKLAQTLLDPLGDVIWSASLLCIVPHGLLHYIPFHALYRQTEVGPDYLLEREGQPRKIIYAPSAATLFDYCQRKSPSAQKGCLALGFNDRDLTQAELEAQQIAQAANGISRIGESAIRNVLLTEGADYRYIHLSCHGWFNPAWPMASALSLADGYLDMFDVLGKLRLDAELVTLSACETGRSHILRGDELVGLTRAFLYAGAPSVMVSHWLVDELSTRLLMEHFYRELIANPNPTEPGAKALALSKAQQFIKDLTLNELRDHLLTGNGSAGNTDRQLHTLAAWAGYDSLDAMKGDERLLSHPYYWAPFFLVGDRLSTTSFSSREVVAYSKISALFRQFSITRRRAGSG